MSTEQPTSHDVMRPPEPVATTELAAMSFPGVRRVAGLLFWVVFPVICLATVWFSISGIANHVGNRPTGIKGTYYVTGRTCSHDVCSIGGTFTSDVGEITATQLLGDPRWHIGEQHRVVYDGKSVEVIALPATWDPTTSVMALVGALTYLGVVVYYARAARLPRRLE